MRLSFLFLALLFSCSFLNNLQAQDSLNMKSIYNWQDSTIPKAVVVRNIYNEIWGWYDSTKQREYAIIGSSIGTHFFDVTNPAKIQLVDFVPGREGEVIHRDYKNKGHYLYAVADEFSESLMIMDMSTLPDSVSVVYDRGTFFNNSHNIWIDGDRMYACIPRFSWQAPVLGLAIYDISNPIDPKIIKEYNAQTHPFGNVHDLYVRNDTAFLNCEARGLYVIDFKDPENYDVLAQYTNYPFMGYNHSGWLSADGSKYVMADETHGMPLKYLDVSDFSNIGIDNYLFPEMSFPIQDTNAIAHNPIIRDDYVFCSYYYDGVYIWDMVDPQKPVLAAFYDTYSEPNVGFYHGVWGVYPFLPSGLILASDMQTGLYVLEAGIRGTAIDDEVSFEMKVYPNPAKDILHIKSEQALHNVQISLIDLQGKLVQQKQENHVDKHYQWNIEGEINTGFYFLKISSDAGNFVEKISIIK